MFETDTNQIIASEQLMKEKGKPTYEQEFGKPEQSKFNVHERVRNHKNPLGYKKPEMVKRERLPFHVVNSRQFKEMQRETRNMQTRHSVTPPFIQGVINVKLKMQGKILDFGKKNNRRII